MKHRLLFLLMVLLGYTAGVQAQEAGTISICGHDMEVGNDWGPESGLVGLSAGHIIFTDETHVTFDNVELTTSSDIDSPFDSDIDDLVITLIGKNTITVTGDAEAFLSMSLTFTGTGSLDIKAKNIAIGLASDQTLTINNVSVKADGGTYGITGFDLSLNLTGLASFMVYGKTACIDGLYSLDGDNVLVTSPNGAQYNSTKKSVVDAGGNPIKNEWVKIESAIDIDAKIFPDENFRTYLTETTLGADNKQCNGAGFVQEENC